MTVAPPASGEFDVDGLVDLIGRRLHLVPRCRQKLREVPGRLGLPVWVDDPDFDLHYHIRRTTLPRPGSEGQLHELVARLFARPLDRSRPLWEVYLVEGLEDDRLAIISKIHHAMVDGLGSMDMGALLLDLEPVPRPTPPDDWVPAPEPSGVTLAADAVVDLLRRPQTLVERLTRALGDVEQTVGELARTVGGVWAAARTATSTRPVHPLNAATGMHRRFRTACAPLADHRKVRSVNGGTINDVVLAVVTGGLRRWMISRGEAVPTDLTVRALVPVSVRARRRRDEPAGNHISAYFVPLPVGEPDPLTRLQRVSAAMDAHKRSGQAIGATTLVNLAGLTPPTVHSLGARLTSQFSSRLFNVLVTNVPGPPRPLYALGGRLLDMYPVVPLAGGQAVAIGITSYDGVMHYGLIGDRDAVPDLDVLAAAMIESLEELIHASG